MGRLSALILVVLAIVLIACGDSSPTPAPTIGDSSPTPAPTIGDSSPTPAPTTEVGDVNMSPVATDAQLAQWAAEICTPMETLAVSTQGPWDDVDPSIMSLDERQTRMIHMAAIHVEAAGIAIEDLEDIDLPPRTEAYTSAVINIVRTIQEGFQRALDDEGNSLQDTEQLEAEMGIARNQAVRELQDIASQLPQGAVDALSSIAQCGDLEEFSAIDFP